jgi:hypothetical protein
MHPFFFVAITGIVKAALPKKDRFHKIMGEKD